MLKRQKLKQAVALLAMMSCSAFFAKNYALAATQQPASDRSAKQIRAILEACLKQDEDLRYATAKVAALEKLDQSNKELISALDAQILNQTKTIDALKAAADKSGQIEILSEKELKSYQASLDDAKKQIEKWKGRAGFWKKVAGFGVTAAIAIGIGIGFALGNK